MVNDGGNYFPTTEIHSLEVQFHEEGTIESCVDLNLSPGVTYVASSLPEGGPTLTLLSGAVGLLGTLARSFARSLAHRNTRSELKFEGTSGDCFTRLGSKPTARRFQSSVRSQNRR